MHSRRSLLFAGLAVPLPLLPQSTTERPPAVESALVKDFVIAGHNDLEKVQTMLAARPALLNATWDWGGGDFETALGGASHMGRRDIALFLLDKGARMDLFAAAMLGKVDIIKAALAAFPDIHKSLGPHKIPMIAHAKKGGEDAVAVVKLLEPYQAARASAISIG